MYGTVHFHLYYCSTTAVGESLLLAYPPVAVSKEARTTRPHASFSMHDHLFLRRHDGYVQGAPRERGEAYCLPARGKGPRGTLVGGRCHLIGAGLILGAAKRNAESIPFVVLRSRRFGCATYYVVAGTPASDHYLSSNDGVLSS